MLFLHVIVICYCWWKCNSRDWNQTLFCLNFHSLRDSQLIKWQAFLLFLYYVINIVHCCFCLLFLFCLNFHSLRDSQLIKWRACQWFVPWNWNCLKTSSLMLAHWNCLEYHYFTSKVSSLTFREKVSSQLPEFERLSHHLARTLSPWNTRTFFHFFFTIFSSNKRSLCISTTLLPCLSLACGNYEKLENLHSETIISNEAKRYSEKFTGLFVNCFPNGGKWLTSDIGEPGWWERDQ